MTATELPIDKAEVIAFFLESLLYGVLATLYAITIWVLFSKRNGRFNLPLFAMSTVMIVLATMHLGIDVYRMLEAFTVRPNPVEFFALISDPTSVLKSVVWVTQTVAGDSFVIYRAYVVWGRNIWVAVLPATLVIASAATGYAACVSLARSHAGTSVFAIKNWITSLFSISLATNIICTALVAFRIWSTHRRVRNYGSNSLWPVMIIVIESGAIFSAGLLALLICFAAGSNGQYPALDANMPLVGITFNLIIVRIGLGLAQNSTTPRIASQRQQHTNPSRVHMPTVSTTSRRVEGGEDQYPLRDMGGDRLSIKVSQVVQEHSDDAQNSSHSFLPMEEEPEKDDAKWTPV